MHLMHKTLAGALVLLASALANAEGLEWVAKDARATAVVGGGSDEIAFNICRATLGTGVVPGKFWTSGDRGGECRIATGGSEQGVTDFQVLAEKPNADAAYAWIPGHATSYPQRSVIGGSTADGQRLLVCAALHTDGSLHPGYIQDENCVFGKDGAQFTSDTYLVLATTDAAVATTEAAQPGLEGFDPGKILVGPGVASFCAQKEGACVSGLPGTF